MISPELMMLGLAFLAVAGLVIHSNDDDDGSDSPTVTEPVPPDEGTEGDDTVTAYDPETDEDGILSLLGGDDLLQLDMGDPSEVPPLSNDIYLGDGDDSMIGGNFGPIETIDAGDGDDLIIDVDIDGDAFFNDDSGIYGGAGDDTISGRFANSHVFGGEGDDLIQTGPLHTRVFGEQWHQPYLEGGEGDDTFELSVLTDGSIFDTLSAEYTDWEIATIGDFRSGRDELVIDPLASSSEGTEFQGYEIVQGDAPDVYFVRLTYSNPNFVPGEDEGYYSEHVSLNIRVVSAQPLVDSDIRIVTT